MRDIWGTGIGKLRKWPSRGPNAAILGIRGPPRLHRGSSDVRFSALSFGLSYSSAIAQYPAFRNRRNFGYWGGGDVGNEKAEVSIRGKMVDLRGNPFI